tara:strand:+ start:11779 stop:12219 length:441 start_codon:yes stop_codon:yes gene_type:complete
MKLRFIFLGKKNSKPFDQKISDYKQRLSRYVKLDCLSFDDSNLSKLEHKVISQIKNHDKLIVLDEKGDEFSTVNFSKFINNHIMQNQSLVFLIGNAHGVPLNIRNKANYLMSLSKMTLPHMFARLIILEQSYRAFCILNNHPYHHE